MPIDDGLCWAMPADAGRYWLIMVDPGCCKKSQMCDFFSLPTEEKAAPTKEIKSELRQILAKLPVTQFP
jgi:hypothetical protein